MLKVDWAVVPLSHLAVVQTGVAKGGRTVHDPIELPYLRVANVQAGSLDLREIKTIKIDRRDVARYSLQTGDVLMTEGGDFDKLGRGTIWRGEIDPCLHQNHVFAVRCDRARLLPEWLSYVAGSSYGRRYFTLCSKQSTNLASINSTQLKAFPIPLPSVAAQRSCADLLGSSEAHLATNDRLIRAKRDFRRKLAQQVLSGQRRFPEFRGRPWHSSSLEKHVTQVTRRNAPNLQLVITASGEHGLVDQRRYFKRRVAGSDLTKYYLLRQGEFAYNRSAMIEYPFGATKRLDLYDAGAISTLYLCFAISDPRLDSDYLGCVFESGVLERQLRRIARVGARAHGLLNVTDDDFFAISIPLPQLDEQRRIAELLKLVDREIDLLVAQRDGVEQQKAALLNRLLAGESAVPS